MQSMLQELHNQIDEKDALLAELYQILGYYQAPDLVLDKIQACIHGEYDGRFYDEYPYLLPFTGES